MVTTRLAGPAPVDMAAPTSRSTSSSSSDDLVASEPATPSSRSSTFNTLRPQRQTVRPAHRPVTSPSTPRRDRDRPGTSSCDGHHALGALGGVAYSLVSVHPSSSSRTARASHPHTLKTADATRNQTKTQITDNAQTTLDINYLSQHVNVGSDKNAVPPSSSSRTTRASYSHSDPRRRVWHGDIMHISSGTSSSLNNNTASSTYSTSPPRSSADHRRRLSLYHLDPNDPPRTTRSHFVPAIIAHAMQSQTKMQASPAFADDVLTTLDSPFQSFYNHVVSDKNTSSCKPSAASNHNTSDSYEPPVDADRLPNEPRRIRRGWAHATATPITTSALASHKDGERLTRLPRGW